MNTLASRIDAEFMAVEQKIKKFQAEQTEQHRARQKRLELLGKVFDQMRQVWKPRLELLDKKFGDRVHVEPRILQSTREAPFDFKSRLGRVSLNLKDDMVEDPVAKVRFPTFAAAATLEWQGRKFYFVGDETRREFAKQNGITVS
jgi:hypothetical protein